MSASSLAVSVPRQQPPSSAPELIDLSSRLADLLERETAALLAMKLQEADAFAEEKMRLTRRYRATIEELRAGRTTLRETAAPLRAELVMVATRLTDAARENERALRAGRAAVQSVIAAIAEAVRANDRSTQPYRPPRQPAAKPRVIAGLAVDRSL
ncbi:MAG TPA: hypothetical protein VMC10_18185 [Stellaceae bacterium]|nr:hypothetical protein [Stellaceae bacterium]